MCWVGMDFLFVGGYWIWFLASLFFAPSGKLLPSFFCGMSGGEVCAAGNRLRVVCLQRNGSRDCSKASRVGGPLGVYKGDTN